MEFVIKTTAEQDAALAELCAHRNALKLDPLDPDSTPASLIETWALHPLRAMVAQARADARAEAIAATEQALASDDPDIRAEAETVQAALDALAARVRAARTKGAAVR